jgi:hypothetical protein
VTGRAYRDEYICDYTKITLSYKISWMFYRFDIIVVFYTLNYHIIPKKTKK